MIYSIIILQIKLSDVQGSGKDGRILKDDIVKYLDDLASGKGGK